MKVTSSWLRPDPSDRFGLALSISDSGSYGKIEDAKAHVSEETVKMWFGFTRASLCSLYGTSVTKMTLNQIFLQFALKYIDGEEEKMETL